MSTLIVVHPTFESHWPFVAGRFLDTWSRQGKPLLTRLARDDNRRLGEIVSNPTRVIRLVCLGAPVTVDCLRKFTALKEATFQNSYNDSLSEACGAYLVEQGVAVYNHHSEGFWGQSVSEFALALTISALRRIPQNYAEMLTDHRPWERYRPSQNQGPERPGAQFSDDLRFTNGTVGGKRVRIVGAGNIGSRYASFVKMLGADVAAWDPFAAEAHFHRAGSRREWRLDELVKEADIFAPMLPLTASTRGLVTAEHIRSLPKGCLVVLATRANICDMAEIRRRVLADELALAADVFDIEPLPLDDPLLGRHNVIHTPHLAGRTRDANWQWADDLIAQFSPG
jgi:phosphoglycerate dehydrogenase-like enzyme